MQCHNIPINARARSGKTPLHESCSYGSCSPELVGSLLAHPDINVNATTRFGASALHYVVKYAHHKTILPCARALLRHPFIIADLKDIDNKTPLDILTSRLDLANNDLTTDMLPFLTVKTLLEAFPVNRRWGLYQYLLDHW